jgi:hypothetical protein
VRNSVVSGIIEKLGIQKKPVLDDNLSILVEEEEIGEYKTIFHRMKEISFRVPKEIDRELTVRLKGLGKKKGNQTGNLLIHVWVNKGEDSNAILWLSESSARNGATKKLSLMGRTIEVVVPKGSSDGSIITIKGQGKEAEFPESITHSDRKKGDLLVTLRTYLDYIYLKCRPFDSLDTEDMAREGWVYLKIDEIVSRLGQSILDVQPVIANTIVDIFNESGLKGVFSYLINHFQLSNRNITLEVSDSISEPGKCENFGSGGSSGYKISVNGMFIHNPFTVTAILAHELAHVLYLENFGLRFQSNAEPPHLPKDKRDWEGELTVDLLVFMYKLGGFQIRVSRDRMITMGYFRQDQFDRIYVITMKYYRKRKWDMKT